MTMVRKSAKIGPAAQLILRPRRNKSKLFFYTTIEETSAAMEFPPAVAIGEDKRLTSKPASTG